MVERDNKPRKRKPAGDDSGDVENQSDEEKKTKKPPPSGFDFQSAQGTRRCKPCCPPNWTKSATKIVIQVLLVVFILFGLYIAIVPSPIEPISVSSNQALPYFDGVLAPNNRLQQITKIGLNKLQGPESMQLDREGNIYTGLHDGRIVKITKSGGIEEVARTGERLPNCGKEELEHKCGRPLGLHFDMNKENLIIADGYLGLLKLNIKTLELTTLMPASEGIQGMPFKFLNHLAVSSKDIVYFTDSSWKWGRKEWPLLMLEGGGQGRVISYDLKTGESEVLLNGLFFANGVALSPDEDFLLVSETSAHRIVRYFIKGKNKGIYDLFADNLPGFPDNIRASVNGGYWVALPSARKWPFSFLDFIAPYPRVKNIVAKLIPKHLFQNLAKPYGLVIKLDYYGDIVKSFHDSDGSVISAISEVYEDAHNKILYLGSFKNNFLGKLRLFAEDEQ